jgi:copper(I)-binding protein
MKALIGAAAVAAAAASPAFAMQVKDAVIRAVPAGVPNSAGYMTLVNPDRAEDKLISAACACAKRVEAHLSHEMNGSAMMMPAGPVSVPAGGALAFRPGSYHLMLMGVSGLKDGGTAPVTLKFAHAGTVTVDFAVKSRIDLPPAP